MSVKLLATLSLLLAVLLPPASAGSGCGLEASSARLAVGCSTGVTDVLVLTPLCDGPLHCTEPTVYVLRCGVTVDPLAQACRAL